MRALQSFEYAIIRLVPRVERGEFINVGVIVFCLGRKWLECRLHVDASRLQALWPDMQPEDIACHLAAIPDVCAGVDGGGPIARLSQRERFHWLVAPRSTVIQVSPVHSGLCDDPESAMERLFRKLVEV